MAPTVRFPSLGLVFCPECHVELEPDLDTYKDGRIEYSHRFHNVCVNSDGQWSVLVPQVEGEPVVPEVLTRGRVV